MKKDGVLYFAYGSNMSTARLKRRAPSTSPFGIGFLHGHALVFHKTGMDRSGKCDAFSTGNPEDLLAGVLFRIDPSDRPSLDRHEGRGNGYEVKYVSIKTESDEDIPAFLFYATSIDPALRPYHWYKEHVITGAREHRLPSEYIGRIISCDSIKDPDTRRALAELSLYRSRETAVSSDLPPGRSQPA